MADGSPGTHLLNLNVLADEDVTGYGLLMFEGREAISEPFEYRLEIIAKAPPTALNSWIGKLVDFSVQATNGDERNFAGRIYEAHLASDLHGPYRVRLVVRPAYWATCYARGTHFMQDRQSLDIFSAITGNVPGLVTDVSAEAPPQRPYITRYDETEMHFLDRILAQDGIFYFFTYDRGAGNFRHKMHIASAASAYQDTPNGGVANFTPGSDSSTFQGLNNRYGSTAGSRRYHAFDVNKLDTPFTAAAPIGSGWGNVYSHEHEELTGNALATGEISGRGDKHSNAVDNGLNVLSGTSKDPSLFAGGRVDTDWEEGSAPSRIVLTSVTHAAYDGSALGPEGEASYHNSFTGIDANLVFHPPAPSERRRAYGPVLGTVAKKDAVEGEVVIDNQSRIPVEVSRVYEGDPNKPFGSVIWVPVQQAWSSSTHGAQFFPRIGTRVIIDFLYGDPDLPFVAGTMYTPSAQYPFDPASAATQTGWRSRTDKNGGITQEIRFEDKPGAEEIYIYSGRNYTRTIDKDENTQVKHDQTIKVTNDRTLNVTGVQSTTIKKTRTVTVTKKSMLESFEEIEFKVGPSTITMNKQGIEIKAPKITIKADATLDVSAGGQAHYDAPQTQVTADATLTLKGGMVLIN